MSGARFLALHDVGRECDHRGDVGDVRGHHQRARRLVRKRPELLDVLLGDPQLHGLGAATPGQRLADLLEALRRRRGHREDRRRLALGLVDLLLLVGLGLLDDALLLALGLVDLGVALSLGRQHHRALLALGTHLLLHRREHVLRRVDVLDLVAQHLDAPGRGGLIELGDDVRVDRAALLERAVELDLADLAAQRRLRELHDREPVVGDAVGGPARVQHLHVEHAVDADLDVVARDADLLRDVHRLLLEVVLVGDAVEEGLQDVEPGLDRAVVTAERLDDVSALLRHDDRGLGDDDDGEQYDDADCVSGFHACGHSTLMCRVRPSTCAITASRPASIASSPALRAAQLEPRYSTRPTWPGSSLPATTTRSPIVSRSSTWPAEPRRTSYTRRRNATIATTASTENASHWDQAGMSTPTRPSSPTTAADKPMKTR